MHIHCPLHNNSHVTRNCSVSGKGDGGGGHYNHAAILKIVARLHDHALNLKMSNMAFNPFCDKSFQMFFVRLRLPI